VSKKNKKGLSDRDILSKFSGCTVPISVLQRQPLTTYEALIVHLKDNAEFNYHNIAVLLGRDDRDVRKVYLRSMAKLGATSKVLGKYCRCKVPLSALRKKPLTTYEALVVHLKHVSQFNYHTIAVLLGRDERDIRKVYLKAKDKLEK